MEKHEAGEYWRRLSQSAASIGDKLEKSRGAAGLAPTKFDRAAVLHEAIVELCETLSWARDNHVFDILFPARGEVMPNELRQTLVKDLERLITQERNVLVALKLPPERIKSLLEEVTEAQEAFGEGRLDGVTIVLHDGFSAATKQICALAKTGKRTLALYEADAKTLWKRSKLVRGAALAAGNIAYVASTGEPTQLVTVSKWLGALLGARGASD